MALGKYYEDNVEIIEDRIRMDTWHNNPLNGDNREQRIHETSTTPRSRWVHDYWYHI